VSNTIKNIINKLNTEEVLTFDENERSFFKQNIENVFDDEMSLIDAAFIGKDTYSQKEFNLWKGLNPYRVKEIYKQIIDIEFMYGMFNSAIDNNYITFPSPLSDNTVKSSTSFAATNTVFFRFYDQGEVFYISQHYNFIDTLFFPKRNLIISFDGGGAAWENEIKHLGRMIVYKFDDYITAVNDKEKTFGGIIVSDESPYHFFYNHLFCTELLYEKKILHKIKKIYVIQKEWYYFDLKKLYEACSFSFNVLTNVHIEAIEKKAKNREFYLNGVLLRKRIKPESIRRSFQRVADTAPLLIDDKFKSIHEEVQKYSPVIWMGITGQKRRWIEQEEGYANIISRLHKKYPNIAIIMDGWTTGKYDEAYCKSNVNIQKDMQVVENIKALIDDDIPLFNIVGRSSIEKISIGNLVDFFIANNGTGSMNIDTICMRPGITHISNRFRRSSELGNINYSQNLIAEEKVTDLETDSEFKHVGDYSINWEDIMAMVDTFIKQMDNGELITQLQKS